MSLHSTPSPTSAAAPHTGPRTLARRIVGSELPGFLSRTLEVPLGQRAVLLDGGRYVATLPSGRHELEGWKRGAGSTAVLVDESAIPLPLERAGLASADHQDFHVAVELGLRVTTPEVFVAQRVRDREHYTLEELQAEVGSELLWVVEELVTARGVGELTHTMGKERLRLDLLGRMQPICERSGLLLERLAGLRVEAPDHAATERFEQKAQRARAEYEHELVTLQGGQARLRERLLRESLELDHEIASRRKVAEQKLEERRKWFKQHREEQTFARQEQMKKLWEMARIDEMRQERKQELLQTRGRATQGKASEGMGPAGEPSAAGNFQAAKEQEAPQEIPRPPRWRRCPSHGIKYDANGGDCPLCERVQGVPGGG